MRSDVIVDSRLSINHNLDHSLRANSLFLASSDKRAHLATQLLIYDKIVIPTKDFGIAPILIYWFGLKGFERALNSETINFLHRASLLGYGGSGAGAGISQFVIFRSDQRPFEWWQDALFGDMPKAIEIQLRVMCPFIGTKQRTKLVQLILERSKSLEYDNDFFVKNIVHETYTDIMQSPDLSAVVSGLSGMPERVDLTRVPGVAQNEMKVSNMDQISSPADLILRVAEINVSLIMGEQFNRADVFIPAGSDQLLKAKLARSKVSPAALDNFISLLDLEDIPDISVAVEAGAWTLDDIWKIRRGWNSRRFRKWLRAADTGSARDLEKAYVGSLGRKSFYEGLPTKVLRFAVTALADQLLPLSGTLLGVVDSFFVEKWLKGYSPKVFLDDLRKLK